MSGRSRILYLGKRLIWGLVKSWVWQQCPFPQATWARLQSLALTWAKSTGSSLGWRAEVAQLLQRVTGWGTSSKKPTRRPKRRSPHMGGDGVPSGGQKSPWDPDPWGAPRNNSGHTNVATDFLIHPSCQPEQGACINHLQVPRRAFNKCLWNEFKRVLEIDCRNNVNALDSTELYT